jgi:UDP-N-acetylmuramoyl-tripeptide--D-alanyl-D-alanine ligase
MEIDKKTLAQVIAAQDITMQNNYLASGVEFDSRKIQQNNIFVALKGQVSDGHNYLKDAYANQANLFIVENHFAKDLFVEPERLIPVTDTLQAFQHLATWHRQQLTIPVIAVTGSTGKTTVKSMLAAILSGISPGSYSQKSYNNHVGVAHTLCNISNQAAWAVVEMGMNNLGEIELLANMALPDLGIITNIEPAHIGMLGSLENIAQAKLEIVKGLKPGSALIIPYSNQVLNNKIEQLQIAQQYKLYTFGVESQADCVISNIQQHGLEGVSCKLKLFGEILEIKINSLGEHNIFNAAAAVLASKLAFPDIASKVIQQGLARYIPPDMRLNIVKLANSKIVINDAYNSNPAAVNSALQVVKNLAKSGQKIGVIIGDMLELGKHAEYYHQQIAANIVKLNPQFVVAVGEFSGTIASFIRQQNISNNIRVITALNAADSNISEFVNNLTWDILLLKGSRGVGLEKIAENIYA